jgi:succinyl-diaminopimelate desuccinylase
MLDCIEISRKLIKFPSITPDNAGTIDFLANVLQDVGFICQKFIFDDPIYNAPVHNLYARLGNKGKNFCFAGHTDVVPVGDLTKWSADPFVATIKNDYLYGRGTSDMKCAIACFISAVSAIIDNLKDIKNLNNSISLLITGDEEGHATWGTPKVLEALRQQQEIIDFCLIGEPSSENTLGDNILIGRRGSLNAKLEIYGKQGHVAYPEQAHNPINDLHKAIQALTESPLDAGNKYFQPSNLEFTSIDTNNTTCNMIPNKISANFNIRFNDQYNTETLNAALRSRLDNLNINYQLNTSVSGESFINHPDDYCNIISQAIQQFVKVNPTLSTAGGISDARFIKEVCPFVELGLATATAHQIDERVKVADIYNLTKIYQVILEQHFSCKMPDTSSTAHSGITLP